MRAMILQVIVPDSWRKIDVLCAMNIGLKKHFQTESSGPAIAVKTELGP